MAKPSGNRNPRPLKSKENVKIKNAPTLRTGCTGGLVKMMKNKGHAEIDNNKALDNGPKKAAIEKDKENFGNFRRNKQAKVESMEIDRKIENQKCKSSKVESMEIDTDMENQKKSKTLKEKIGSATALRIGLKGKQKNEKVTTKPKNNSANKSNVTSIKEKSTSMMQKVFSLPPGVVNIDADETASDPQMCAENAYSIFCYMRHLEALQDVKQGFLTGSSISAKMRAVLVNWLSEVHLQFKLLTETLYLTVTLVDRYISLIKGEAIKRQEVQLIGVTAMLIACKYEEMYIPTVDDFVYITDNAYTVKEILRMEVKMISALKFNIGRPSSIHFLRRDSKAGSVDVLHHKLAQYILEACLPEYSLAHVMPSQLAAASLLLSIRLLEKAPSFEGLWNINLAFYAGYQVAQLLPTVQKMATVLKDIKTSKFRAAYEKYNLPSRQKVAASIESNPEVMELLKSISESS